MKNRVNELKTLLNENCKNECEECCLIKECEEYLNLTTGIKLNNERITGRCPKCGGILITDQEDGFIYTVCVNCDFYDVDYDL